MNEMFLNEEIRIAIAKDLFVQWAESNMNEDLEDGQAIALKGRVPVRITGTVKKGQAVYVHNDGCASTVVNGGSLVGIALESDMHEEEKLVECVLKT